MAKQISGWKKLVAASGAARRNVNGMLAEAERLIQTGNDAISAHRALAGELAAWEKDGPALATRAKKLLDRVANEKDVQSDTLEQRIARELKGLGHNVFGETSLLVVDGIAHVDIDAKAGTVKVNDSSVDELDVRAIVERVREELSRLTGLLTKPADLLKVLLDAYEREVRFSGLTTGSQVHATALALHVAMQRQPPSFRNDPATRNFREYPRVLFRADLHTLLASREITVRGHTFRYASGADTSGAVFMLVPATGRMAHVGRIWFETEGKADDK